jgi:glutamine amidotransferase
MTIDPTEPTDITIVDYGVGNIQSLVNMLNHIGVDATATGDVDAIAGAKKLILPGVGAFDRAMRALRTTGLSTVLTEAVVWRQTPVLGVCLGMQLMTEGSEEGSEPGLGWIAADARRIRPLDAGRPLKVPHVGWATVSASRKSLLFDPGGAPERFYFVHSYFVTCRNPVDVAATVDYGGEICCALSRGQIHGVQFHPEKSHRFGMRVLSAFAKSQKFESSNA